MGVDTYEDMKERMADIWLKWLKICYRGATTNQSRWKVKEFWEVIQDGFSPFGQAWGVLPYKVKKVQYEHLKKQARGVMVSACASLASGHGIHAAILKTRREINDIMSEDFRNDVIARIPLVGNMAKPDTHLVDEAIRLGAELIEVEFKDECCS